jgi:hypothetical protein
MGGRYLIVDTGSWLAAVRFFMYDQSWTICHLVFEAGHWFFGKQSSFSPNQINRISCEASKVFAKMTNEAILQAPEYQVPSVVAA